MRKVVMISALVFSVVMMGQKICFFNTLVKGNELLGDDRESELNLAMEEQKIPVIKQWPNDGVICCGEVFGSFDLKGGLADVDGVFVFEDFTIKPDAGIHNVKVFFIPSDTVKYAEVSGFVKVRVGKMDQLASK